MLVKFQMIPGKKPISSSNHLSLQLFKTTIDMRRLTRDNFGVNLSVFDKLMVLLDNPTGDTKLFTNILNPK